MVSCVIPPLRLSLTKLVPRWSVKDRPGHFARDPGSSDVRVPAGCTTFQPGLAGAATGIGKDSAFGRYTRAQRVPRRSSSSRIQIPAERERRHIIIARHLHLTYVFSLPQSSLSGMTAETKARPTLEDWTKERHRLSLWVHLLCNCPQS